MRCKACDANMELTFRTIEEDGRKFKVEEDLCPRCIEQARDLYDDLDMIEDIIDNFEEVADDGAS